MAMILVAPLAVIIWLYIEGKYSKLRDQNGLLMTDEEKKDDRPNTSDNKELSKTEKPKGRKPIIGILLEFFWQ